MTIRFKIRAVPLLAALACLAASVSIGNVQRGRAEQKQATFDRMERLSQDAPIQVGAAPADAVLLDRHPAMARGIWAADKSVLIDNKVRNGVAGYHVITPLRIEGAQISVLVNRGWIAAPRLRSELPALPMPAGTAVVVKGVVQVPHGKAFELAPDRSQGRVWQHLSLERFGAWSGLALQPIILLQTDGPHDGLVREWQPAESGALKHWGFALVWYLAAAAAAVAAGMAMVEVKHDE